MSTELERQLEGFLDGAPEPGPEVGEGALRRALAVLDVHRPRRRAWATGLGLAAAVGLLAVAAGALAAAGALHVSFGNPKGPQTLKLPAGAHGMSVVVDGRLSVVTKSGFRLEGLRVSTASLSPHALYVAAGIGDSLVVMAPDGHRAWSHSAGGTVTAIAWAPDGLRIAYVVRHTAHVIWGNGTHDRVIDRSVRSVRPSWRADSLAFAYVGAGGRAIVYDLAHESRRVLHPRAEGSVVQVAFAPTGDDLVTASRSKVDVLRPGLNQVDDSGIIAGIGWTGKWLAVAHGGAYPLISLTANPQLGAIHLTGTIDALGATGHGLAVAVTSHGRTSVLAAVTGTRLRTVLQLPREATVRDLELG